jgi:hypothetical protein
MSVAPVQRSGPPQGSWEDFLAVLSNRAVWKLLVKGIGVFLPEYTVSTGSVLVADSSSVTGAPVFLNGEAGFGLHLRQRRGGLEPDREIYIRGREVRSIGVVASGSGAALGSRVIDAAGLLRYGRKLTFQTLFDATEARTAISAVRAAKAVENVIFLDLPGPVLSSVRASRRPGVARRTGLHVRRLGRPGGQVTDLMAG